MDYTQIKSLVESEDLKNEELSVTFTCKETGVTETASVNVSQKASDKIKSEAMNSAKKQLMRSAKRSLSRLIRSSLGSGTIGRIGRDVAGSALGNFSESSGSKNELSGEQRENAILEAFEQVNTSFVWNNSLNKMVGVQKELMTPYGSYLQENPLKERYDKVVLARILTEIAASDNNVSADEKQFMENFITEDIASVDDLLKKEPLSDVEITEVSKGNIRETITLLAWGVAFSDDELSNEEKQKINHIADILGIESERQQELKEMAAQYVIDQMFTSILAGGNFDSDKKEAYSFVEKLDVSEELIQRTEINFKKRNLLF